jgi:iron complex outermembrane recepter protein
MIQFRRPCRKHGAHLSWLLALPGLTLIPLEAGAREGVIEEIVVQAQRRTERLVDVPIAVTAIGGADLRESGVTNTSLLGQVVPGLRLDLSGGYFQPTVRGVGSATAGVGISSNVATYVDGVYRPSPFTTNFEFADIQSIQVLKGPQGTLFGRNATGGAILVVTEDPGFETSINGTVGYGRYDERRASIGASTALSDTVAVGLSGVYAASDGYVQNVASGADEGDFERYLIRGKLLFKPREDMSFLLTGERYKAEDQNLIAYTAYEGRTFARVVPDLPVPDRRGKLATDIDRRFEVSRNAVSLRGIFDFSNLTVTSITAYSDEEVPHQNIDFDATALPGLSVNIPSEQKTFTQEVTLVTDNGGNLDWVVGLYFFRDRNVQPSYDVSVGGEPSFNLFRVGDTTEAYAAFVDGTYALTDKLFLSLGARYSREEQTGFFQVFPPSDKVSAEETFDGFTPRAVIRYELDPGSNVYLSYNRGFKAGGFAPTTFDLTPFKNEQIDAYELGYKTARSLFSFESSLFFYDYTNLQVANYTSGVGVITNAAESEVYGADAQFSVSPTDGLAIRLGIAYTNSEYTDFPNSTFYPGTGLPDDPVRVDELDVSGNPLVRAPKWSGNLSASYDYPVGAGNVRFYSNFYRTSSFNFDPAGQFEQEAYNLLNGRITYTAPGDQFSIALYGNNLTNENYLTQVLPFSGAILQTYGTPATYGVELSFDW